MAFFSGVQRLLRHPPLLNSHFTSIRLSSTLTIPELLVSGLRSSVTDGKLKEAFSPFGQVVEATVMTNRDSGRSKGFGFVTYATVEEAEKAMVGMRNKFLDGWAIIVDPAKPRPPNWRDL